MAMQRRDDDEIDLGKYVNVLMRRKVTLAVCVVLSIAMFWLLERRLEKTFIAKAVIQNGSFEFVSGNGQVTVKPIVTIEEVRVILESTAFMKPVLAKAGLDVRDTDIEDFVKSAISFLPISGTNFYVISVKLPEKEKEKIVPLRDEIIRQYFTYGEGIHARYKGLFSGPILVHDFKVIEASDRIRPYDRRDFFALSVIAGFLSGVIVAFIRERSSKSAA